MSSASVCQGLQSCLEPRQAHHHLKPRPHSQSHSRAQPPRVATPNPFETCDKEGDSNGWSSIQLLCAPYAQTHHQLSPVHAPPPPRSSPSTYAARLSSGKRNWELCTETLGCETGAACYVADFNAVPAPNLPGSSSAAKLSKRRSPPASAFPPPLTTLSGQERLQMRSSREDGRLLLIPSRARSPLLEVRRTEGRLCLRLLSSKPDLGTQVIEKHAAAEENRDEEEEEEEGGYLGIVGKEMNGLNHNGSSVAEEMAMGKYTRAGGCKEEEGGGSSKAMVNWDWEAIWVASS